MADGNEVDPLFEIKNNFYLGNYQQCINECQKLKSSEHSIVSERDAFLYRSYIAQKKFGVVLDAVGPSSSDELKSIRLLAEYLSAPAAKKQQIARSLEERMGANINENDYVSILTAATIFLYERNSDFCLRLLHQSEHLECLALIIQTLISIDRLDIARKELVRMQAIDEDSTLTQLAAAQVGIGMGGEKLQDAFYTYQELIDKYGSTTSLLNGQASALMSMGRWEDAEPVLQEAMDKDSNHPDTLINMVVLSQHLGKDTDVSGRYVSQLKDSYRSHPWVQELIEKEAEFDKLRSAYSPATPN